MALIFNPMIRLSIVWQEMLIINFYNDLKFCLFYTCLLKLDKKNNENFCTLEIMRIQGLLAKLPNSEQFALSFMLMHISRSNTLYIFYFFIIHVHV